MVTRQWNECYDDAGKTNDEKTILAKTIAGKRDPLKGAQRVEPILLRNKYDALQVNDDTDDQTEIETDAIDNDNVEHRARHKLNKRQRQRRKAMQAIAITIDNEDDNTS